MNKFYDINLAKKDQALKDGYNFEFIINKNYEKINI